MELTKAEVEAVKHVVEQAEQTELVRIEDFQLALVGGGIADPVWA